MWLWDRGLELFVSFVLCGAGFNLLGGPPPLLPGARWPLCVACGACVGHAGTAPSGVCGGLLRLVLQVRVSRAVLYRRRVVLWRVALWRAVVRCALVSRCAAVGQWRSAWPVSWCRLRAGVWLACG